MARLLGDRVLPESVQSRRRQLRTRLQDLRQPIRQRRTDLPTPDIIGTAETQITRLRDRFVTRESVLERIQERRATPPEEEEAPESRNRAEQQKSSML